MLILQWPLFAPKVKNAGALFEESMHSSTHGDEYE